MTQVFRFGASVQLSLLLLLLWSVVISAPRILFNMIRRLFPPKEKNLRGKHVLITGSGKGLGREMALQFAKNGSRVICVDIDEKANEETCREINKFVEEDVKAKAYTCDVGNMDAIKDLKNLVIKDFGHVDVLVNNAGLLYGHPILDEDERMVQKVIDVNQMSSYWMSRSFLPHMKDRNEGHIVFINSIASLVVLCDTTIYSMTKYALLGLAATLADELSRDPKSNNIKISSVHPYFIATEGLKADPRAINIPALKPKTAAAKIVTGVKREYFRFTIPGFELGFWLLNLSRAFPRPIYQTLSNLLYARIVNEENELHKD